MHRDRGRGSRDRGSMGREGSRDRGRGREGGEDRGRSREDRGSKDRGKGSVTCILVTIQL